MRLWHFSSSVKNQSSNVHAQPSSGARCLMSAWTLRLLRYFVCANSEGSGARDELGDNCIQNVHLGRYIVNYMVGNFVLRRRVSGAVKRYFRPYNR